MIQAKLYFLLYLLVIQHLLMIVINNFNLSMPNHIISSLRPKGGVKMTHTGSHTSIDAKD